VKKTTTKKKHEQLPNENRYTRNRKHTRIFIAYAIGTRSNLKFSQF